MALRVLHLSSAEGRRALERLHGRGTVVVDPDVLEKARKIVQSVRQGGDGALLEAVAAYDGVDALRVSDLRFVPQDDPGDVSPQFQSALEEAIHGVERFHRPQVQPGYRLEEDGVFLEERRAALGRVGLYIPGGRFPYPSTVVMMVVPARLAGVAEIVVVTPPQSLATSAALRFTLKRLGVGEIWGMGGAHAVAALAYGTETLPRVDKILGPGNAWVTAAKQLVAGDVGVDKDAGPSEVLIVADSSAPPDLVASDLLAQAEHDPGAATVLVTTDEGLAHAVADQVEEILNDLPTAQTAGASLENFGMALVVGDWEEALEVVEGMAPEHLQLVGGGPEALAPRVTSAGAIFLGASTPVVFGDYIAGPSHVLPTCGTARFASALGVEDFIRRSHCVRFDERAARRWAGSAAVLAEVEGLAAHAGAARRRRSS